MIKFLLLTAIVIVIMSCSHVENYYPLTVGNIWTYKTTLDSQSQINSQTMEITRRTSAQGHDAFERVTTIWDNDSIAIVDTSYIVEIEDFILGYWGEDDTMPDTILVLPFEAGNSWTSENFVATVESLLTIEVPSGYYDRCWLVKYVYPGAGWADVYYAENVGMVKSLSSGGYITITLELESVDLK